MRRCRALLSLLHLAQAIGELELTSPLQVTVVSSTLQWVSRADTVEAEKALLLGPVRVIPREHSNVRCQSIDVVYPQDDVARDRILTQLVAEIGVRDSDPVVAYHGGSLRSDVFARSYRGAAAIGVAPSPSRRVFDHGRPAGVG